MKRKPQPIRAELQLLSSHSEKTDHLTALGLKTREVIECDTRRIVVHLPKAVLQIESLVNLKIRVFFDGHAHSFNATGKILSKKDRTENDIIYEIQLRQYDVKLWGDFLHAAESESHRVQKVFSAMKGDS